MNQHKMENPILVVPSTKMRLYFFAFCQNFTHSTTKLMIFIGLAALIIWSMGFMYFMVVNPAIYAGSGKLIVAVWVFMPALYVLGALFFAWPLWSFLDHPAGLVGVLVLNASVWVIYLIFRRMFQNLQRVAS